MIKTAKQLYASLAILSPWAFLVLRLTGFYNYPGRNTWIFLGLFTLSLITLIFLYDDKSED